MATVTLAARALLAVIFAIAAVTKLRRPQALRTTFRDFGVREPLARFAVLLAPAELVVAVGLLFTPSARWAAGAAVLLLLVFLAGILNALRLGRRPDCGCFGGLSSRPIGRATVVRNGVLLVVAGLVLVSGPGSAVDTWLSKHSAGAIVLFAIALTATIAVVLASSSGLRSLSEPVAAPAPMPQGPVIGEAAPEFNLRDAHGRMRSLRTMGSSDQPLILVFGNSGCGSCAVVLSQLASWEASLAQRVRFAVVSGRDEEQARAVSEQFGISAVFVDGSGETQRAYGVRLTPTAFAISPDGRIVNGPAVGPDAVEDLIRLTLHRLAPILDPWSQTTQAA
jgi:cytochrome oxidase Cu insertion factor (SCO1/SenC/PrrC family)/uncharacterized membrane protein YphA (DoxX/SURF4 family)